MGFGEPSEVGGDAQAIAPEAIASAVGAAHEGRELSGKVPGAFVPGSAAQTEIDGASAVAKARKELTPRCRLKSRMRRSCPDCRTMLS